MFGYIRPCKPELRVKEFEIYKGVYCSLCRRIGRRYGAAARLSLSYDCTFLALLSLSLDEACPGFRKGRCGVNPMKACSYIKEDGRLDYAAGVSVLLSYFNAKDHLKDKGIGRKLAAAAALPFLSFPAGKIKKNDGELYELVKRSMDEQAELEAGTAGVDASAHPTAALLEQLFSRLSVDEAQKTALSRLGYYLGRWVYLMDAADDREDDRKKGNYNPFLNAELSNQQIGEILTLTLNRAIASFELLTIYHYHDILQNILTLGLPMAQRDVCKDKGE